MILVGRNSSKEAERMQEPAVRDFFCGLINVECQASYSHEH